MFQLNSWNIYSIFCPIMQETDWKIIKLIFSFVRWGFSDQSSAKFNYIGNVYCAVKASTQKSLAMKQYPAIGGIIKNLYNRLKRFINNSLPSIIGCFHVYHRCAFCVQKSGWKIHESRKRIMKLFLFFLPCWFERDSRQNVHDELTVKEILDHCRRLCNVLVILWTQGSFLFSDVSVTTTFIGHKRNEKTALFHFTSSFA